MPQKSSNKRFVSAQQVAELAGVSRSAVSRTFTQGASVSKHTKEKVLTAAKELGYHVNHLARGLHTNSNIVCLVTTDINTPFQANLIDHMTRQLQNIGKVAMVINTKGDADSVSSALEQTLNFRAEASVILSGQPQSALIDRCLSNGQRVILVNRNITDTQAEVIRSSNKEAAAQAFMMLYEQGCKTMAVINSELPSVSRDEREDAFIEAANAHNIAVQQHRFGSISYSSGLTIAREMTSIPDGIFCVTDLLACGCLDGLRERGVNVPKDTAIIGFDDIEQSRWEGYQLTTFRQPIERVITHIMRRLQSAEHMPDWSYGFEPVIRQTTR